MIVQQVSRLHVLVGRMIQKMNSDAGCAWWWSRARRYDGRVPGETYAVIQTPVTDCRNPVDNEVIHHKQTLVSLHISILTCIPVLVARRIHIDVRVSHTAG